MRDTEIEARKVIMLRSFFPEIPDGAKGVALGPPCERWVTVAWETGHIRKMFSAEIEWERFSDINGLYPLVSEPIYQDPNETHQSS
jgi:hypothetical protein